MTSIRPRDRVLLKNYDRRGYVLEIAGVRVTVAWDGGGVSSRREDELTRESRPEMRP